MNYSSVARELAQDEAGVLFDVGSLYERFLTLPDPRKARGKVYPLAVVLLAFALAKLAGEDKPEGIADWAKLRCALFVESFRLKHARMPHAGTYRLLIGEKTDLDALERLVDDFLREHLEQDDPQGRWVQIALDGKTLRGTIPLGSTRGLHLLAAYVPERGIVLFQMAVAEKSNEIPAAPQVLKRIDLRGKIVTGDALLAQRDISQAVLDGGGDFVWTIKENQPKTCAAIEKLFQPQQPQPGHGVVATDFRTAHQEGKDHGRIEQRRLTASAMLDQHLREQLDWPGVSQVFRLERRALEVSTGKVRHEVVYGLTSLTPDQAGPERLLDLTQRHWGIENGLHYRRDVTLHEDATRIKSKPFARAVAIVNNLVIGLAMHCGFSNLAYGRRVWAAHPDEALGLLLRSPA